MLMAGPFHPPFSFCTAAKRERAVDGPREKTPRRVGPHQCGPPAAGGGWLAVPCRSQGRKRPALGETSGPGKSGIHPAPLFAAAGRWLMRVAAWANATTSTPARAARSEAERAERGAAQMRPCTPTQDAPSATGRQFQKLRESIACPKAGPNRSRHRYADPRAHGGPLHRSAPSVFLFGPCTARFSFGKTKEKWGVHPGWTSPPGGSQSPEAAVRRPIYPQAVDNRPYGVYRVRIFPNPCNESPAKRTYLTERRENPNGRYGTDLSGPCQDRL